MIPPQAARSYRVHGNPDIESTTPIVRPLIPAVRHASGIRRNPGGRNAVVPARRGLRLAAMCLPALCGALAGCGGSSGGGRAPAEPPMPPPPPANVSLEVSGGTSVEEAVNPKVEITARLDAPASGAVTVGLNLAGTATADRDYAIGADRIQVPANATSASVGIDIYRDFDEEDDETIEIGLGAITGNARAGDPASVALTVLDGGAATFGKLPPGEDGEDGEDDEIAAIEVELVRFASTGDAIVATVAAQLPAGFPGPQPLRARVFAGFDFLPDAKTFTECHAPSGESPGTAAENTMNPCQVAPPDEPFDFFPTDMRVFRLPYSELRLQPNGHYYLEISVMPHFPDKLPSGPFYNDPVLHRFATDPEGRMAVRCRAPERTPAPGGGDPLFSHQWHLVNTGQTAFAGRGGAAGADLRMTAAIDTDRDGAGVKIAVVDSGLEICHPDLAANTAAGGSFNFGAASHAGASPDDPFNVAADGDHGTGVAGVAAAVADNGFGGRGVAPAATLVGFNPREAVGGEPSTLGRGLDTAQEIAILQSLGAGNGGGVEPDAASVDVFNMSFGFGDRGAENAREEWARVIRAGTEQLRSGRGAIYVKGAGNAFNFCKQIHHPLNHEVGCRGANTEPEQNIPWLIVVGGFNADDVKSSYSSIGANLWVVGPSGEDGNDAPGIISTDQMGLAGYSAEHDNRLLDSDPLNRDGDYVNNFGGTSAAAPAVAGAVAILLGVKPELTWRDVKHILAKTARRIDPDIAEVRAAFNGTPHVAQHAWRTNAAGYAFHNWYGFGAVDVDAAVAMAQSHAPDSLGAFVESEWFDGAGAALPLEIPDADGAGAGAEMDVSGLPEGAGIEAVVLEISVGHGNAFDLGVTLRSPSGTSSVVNPPLNERLGRPPGFVNWHLLSNAFYGENPNGAWTLHVADIAPADTGSLTGWRLRFYHGGHGPN